jgi:hypothetical protein
MYPPSACEEIVSTPGTSATSRSAVTGPSSMRTELPSSRTGPIRLTVCSASVRDARSQTAHHDTGTGPM